MCLQQAVHLLFFSEQCNAAPATGLKTESLNLFSNYFFFNKMKTQIFSLESMSLPAGSVGKPVNSPGRRTVPAAPRGVCFAYRTDVPGGLVGSPAGPSMCCLHTRVISGSLPCSHSNLRRTFWKGQARRPELVWQKRKRCLVFSYPYGPLSAFPTLFWILPLLPSSSAVFLPQTDVRGVRQLLPWETSAHVLSASLVKKRYRR